jgi:hypothetical protein
MIAGAQHYFVWPDLSGAFAVNGLLCGCRIPGNPKRVQENDVSSQNTTVS